MLPSPFFRSLSVAVLFMGVGPFTRATHILTVQNQTGKALTACPSECLWLLDPTTPPWDLNGKCRRLAPGAKGTFRRLDPSKDMNADLVIRRLPKDGWIQHEGLVIRVADPDSSGPSGQPEAEVTEGLSTDDLGADSWE